MKNNKILFLVITLLTGILLTSCTDEGKFNNPVHFDLENGAFVRFEQEQNLTPAVDLQSFNGTFVNATIEDVNNNIESYSLTLTAFVRGKNYVVKDFILINSFPSNLTITSQMIADAAGFDINSLDFGDSFDFTAKVVRNDGTEFYAIQPSYSASNQTIGIGNTDITNLGKAGYRDAMQFDFIFACPSFEQSDIIGTYNIVEKGFDIYYNTTVEIIAGDSANEFIIVDIFGHGAEFGSDFDITAVVSGDGTNFSVARQPAFNGSDSNNFSNSYGEGRLDGSGLVFSCLGTINMSLTPTVDAGSFGSRDFVLQKI